MGNQNSHADQRRALESKGVNLGPHRLGHRVANNRGLFSQRPTSLMRRRTLNMSFAVFLVIAIGTSQVQAADLDDFSNNLASDLGPIISLFGDRMTTQYLGESITFLDYLIFSMGPIGIITAIVSAIRVRGGLQLRSFIGRGQESDAAVEVELCTSTNRDVCELFNRGGGITRAFGRPRLLEVVYLPQTSEGDSVTGSTDGEQDQELYLFRDYLRKPKGKPKADSEWVEHSMRTRRRMAGESSARRNPFRRNANGVVDGASRLEAAAEPSPPSGTTRKTEGSADSKRWVQNPNLSINVGIKRLRREVVWLIGIVGVTLQAGVIVMALLIGWKYQWTNDGVPDTTVPVQDAIHDNVSPTLFLVGTISLCAGMFWCAELIGGSTDERRFRRRRNGVDKNGAAPRKTHLLWLQPGNQLIGDQIFDAYAYFEHSGSNSTRPANLGSSLLQRLERVKNSMFEDELTEYMTSTKDMGNRSSYSALFAVILTLGGYVLQFVSLRNMHASVALAQLGVSLVMSVLRGLLRRRRLQADSNELWKIPDVVAGHELDWLALKLSDDTMKNAVFAFTGRCVVAAQVKKPNTTILAAEVTRHIVLGQIFRRRARLANLTGHHPFKPMSPSSFQPWPDEQVLVRGKAREISDAITKSCETLFGGKDLNHDPFKLEFQIRASDLFESHGSVTLDVVPPNKSPTRKWQIDAAKIESILGLWLWSFKKPSSGLETDDHTNQGSSAEEIPTAQILSVSGMELRGSPLDGTQSLKLWLGNRRFLLLTSPYTVTLDGNTHYDSMTVWREAGGTNIGSEAKSLSPWRSKSLLDHSETVDKLRLFGWHEVPHTATGNIELRVSNVRTSLAVQSSQDLYTAILAAIVQSKDVAFGDVVPYVDLGEFRWENTKASALIRQFQESGLGSDSDAFTCVIPALRSRLNCPDTETIAIIVRRLAIAHCKAGEWDRAHALLGPALDEFGPKAVGDATQGQQNMLITYFEACRYALMSDKSFIRLLWGYTKMKAVTEKFVDGDPGSWHRYKSTIEEIDDPVGQICCRYGTLGYEVGLVFGDADDIFDEPYSYCYNKEITAPDGRGERYAALTRFAVVEDHTWTETELLRAAQNGWNEVVLAILEDGEMKVDCTDPDGRTACSFYSESGNIPMVNVLLDMNAKPGLKDKKGMNAIMYAIYRGHERLLSILLERLGHEGLDDDDDGFGITSQAAKRRDPSMTKYLLGQVLAFGSFTYSFDRRLLEGLKEAIRCKHDDVLNTVLEFMSKQKMSTFFSSESPLAMAVQSGHEGMVTSILDSDYVPFDSDVVRASLIKACSKPSLLDLLLAHPRVKGLIKDRYVSVVFLDAAYGHRSLEAALNTLLTHCLSINPARSGVLRYVIENAHKFEHPQSIVGNIVNHPRFKPRSDDGLVPETARAIKCWMGKGSGRPKRLELAIVLLKDRRIASDFSRDSHDSYDPSKYQEYKYGHQEGSEKAGEDGGKDHDDDHQDYGYVAQEDLVDQDDDDGDSIHDPHVESPLQITALRASRYQGYEAILQTLLDDERIHLDAIREVYGKVLGETSKQDQVPPVIDPGAVKMLEHNISKRQSE